MFKLQYHFFSTIILGITFCSCNTNFKKYYEHDIKNISIQGVVTDKYLNYNNHGNPAIKLKDSSGIKDYVPFKFYTLYKIVKKGDSISKPKGSLEYQIFRNDTIIKIYPVINGDTLK